MGKKLRKLCVAGMLGLCITIGWNGPKMQAADTIWYSDSVKVNHSKSVAYKALMTDTSFPVADRTFGKYVFSTNTNGKLIAKKSGKKTVLVSKGQSGAILTNGKIVYYTVFHYGNSADKNYVQVFSVKINGKERKNVFNDKKADNLELCGYYNGKIYYVKEIDPGYLYSYSIKEKKKKKLFNNVTIAEQHGQYFVNTPYKGDWGPGTLRVYDAKNNKSKVITKKVDIWRVIKGKIYFTEFKKIDNKLKHNKFVFKCVNLSGTKEEVLISEIDANYITKCNENTVWYVDGEGKEKKVECKKS